MTRALLCLALVIGACAYFNGIYNAREAAEKGEKLSRAGRSAEAESSFAVAAASAETVLARHPRSKWRSDALFLAGRGAALSGRCKHALGRLTEFLVEAPPEEARRPAAILALGRCYVDMARYDESRTTLEPLLEHVDPSVSADAALWAARAAYAMGDGRAAERYLASAEPKVAQWELARAALAERDYARAESLLTLRAAAGDLSSDGMVAVEALWSAGRSDAVLALARQYESSGADALAVARLHLRVTDLLIAAGEDSLAAAHARVARRRAADSVTRQEAEARLGLLAMHELASLVDVRNTLSRHRDAGAGGTLWRRLQDNLLLAELLARANDEHLASRFLAAEVARDSLRAPMLAHALFRQVAELAPGGPLAAKALLAAADVLPDSSAAYRTRILEQYPASTYAALLGATSRMQGAEPPASDLSTERALLSAAWQRASSTLADSLRTRHPGAPPRDSLPSPGTAPP